MSKKNGSAMKAEKVETEEDLKKYIRSLNLPFGELIIKAREENIKKYGRLLTEEEVKEIYLER